MLTVMGLASGASIGREGPTVQVGASLMLLSARLGGMAHAKGLILAGSAAGIAAAFNTPLAGIVFAIEEMGRSYNARTNGVVLSAVIIAGVASLGLTGSYTYFGFTREVAHFPGDWPLVIACGVAGGVLGAAFSRLTLILVRWARRVRLDKTRKVVAMAAVAGLVVAVVGIATGGMTFGTSYVLQRTGSCEQRYIFNSCSRLFHKRYRPKTPSIQCWRSNAWRSRRAARSRAKACRGFSSSASLW